jgi:hypothetical protein
MKIRSNHAEAIHASQFGLLPLEPAVKHAIASAAKSLTKADLKGKKIESTLLGMYSQAGAVKVPAALNPRHLPVSAFVCMNTGGVLPSPTKDLPDPNTAQHFYLKIGNMTYGPLPFQNPLAKPQPAPVATGWIK